MMPPVSDLPSRTARLVAAVAMLAAACNPAADTGCRSSSAPASATASAPTAWPGEPNDSISVARDASDTLSWRRDETTVELQVPGQSIDWSHDAWSDLHRIRARSTIPTGDQTTELTVVLLMAPGNPQVAIRSSLELPPGASPDDAIRLSLRFPTAGTWRRATGPGDASEVTPPVSSNGWSYPWLQYRRADDAPPVTLWGWHGRGVELTRTRGSHSTLDLTLVSEDETVPCTDDGSPRQIDARATLAWTDVPAVTVATLPDGHPGAIVPVILPPTTADNPPLWRGSADAPPEWAERLRTLSFGHSNPDDPRFGNGGFVGRNLGATLTWPSDLFDADTFDQLRSSLSSSALDLAAPISADLENTTSPVRADLDDNADARSSGCLPTHSSTVLVRNGPTVDTHLPTPLSPNDTVAEGSVSLPSDDTPAVATIAHTDGTRGVLTDSLFTRETVERLASHRETMILGIPLIATRNPLVPGFKHGLLSPERYHQWTTQSDFSSALTTLNLSTDATQVGVLGLRRLIEHWQHSRQTSLRWHPSGALRITHHADEPTDGYTLSTPTSLGRPSGPNSLSSRTDDGGRTSWLHLPATDDQTDLRWEHAPNLPAIDWQISM